MNRTLNCLLGAAALAVTLAATASAQTGSLQGRRTILNDAGTTPTTYNRITLTTPADATLTGDYQLLLPPNDGNANDIIYTPDGTGTLEFTDGNGLFWRLLGNYTTTPYNGTTGNFVGTQDAQNLVIRAGGANSIQFWNGTAGGTQKMILDANGNLGLGVTPGGFYMMEIADATSTYHGLAVTTTLAGGIGGYFQATSPGSIALVADASDVGLQVGASTDPVNGVEIDASGIGVLINHSGSGAPGVGISMDGSTVGLLIENATTAIDAEGNSLLHGDVEIEDDGSGVGSDNSTRLLVTAGSAQGTNNIFVVESNSGDNLFRVDMNGTDARVNVGNNAMRGLFFINNGVPNGTARMRLENSMSGTETFELPEIEAAGQFAMADDQGNLGEVLVSQGDNLRATWNGGTNLAEQGVSHENESGNWRLRLGSTNDGNVPITAARYVRISTGSLAFNDGTNTLVGLTGGAVTINAVGTATTQIGNGVGAGSNLGIGEAALATHLVTINGTAQTAASATPNVRIDHLGGAAYTTMYVNDANNGLVTSDVNGDLIKYDENTVLNPFAWLTTGNTIVGGNNILGTLSANDIDIRTNNTTAATVSGSTQNIGIGTATTTTDRLVVNNTINVVGTTYNGGDPAYRVNGNNFLWEGAGGTDNTFVGNTGNTAVTSTLNTAVGRGAGRSIAGGGGFNTALGAQALFSATTGGSNVAIGTSASFNNATGSNNTVVGTEAGNASGSASNNTFIGWRAGNLTTGSGNVMIGSDVGDAAGFAGFANRLAIDNSSTLTPLILGNFATDQLTLNVAVGTAASFLVEGTAQTATVATPNVRLEHLGGDAVTNTYVNSTTNGIVTSDGNGDMIKYDETTVLNPFAWLTTGNTIVGGNNRFGTNSNDAVEFRTNGTQRFTLTAAGNIENSLGDFNVNDNISPTVNNVNNLGSDALRWANGFFNGASVHIGPANGLSGNTELALGYAGNIGTLNVNGSNPEVSIDAATGTVSLDPNQDATANASFTATAMTLNTGAVTDLTVTETGIARNGGATETLALNNSGGVLDVTITGSNTVTNNNTLGDADADVQALRGTTNINTAGTATTTIGTNGNQTDVLSSTVNIGTGAYASTVNVGTVTNATVNVLGADVNVNTSGTGTTDIGSTAGGTVTVQGNGLNGLQLLGDGTAAGDNTIVIDPGSPGVGSYDLVLNNIANVAPIQDLLWITATNEVRRATLTVIANEGVAFETSAFRLGSVTDGTNPIISNRFIRMDAGGSLTFNNTAGGQTLVMDNTTGNIGVNQAPTSTHELSVTSTAGSGGIAINDGSVALEIGNLTPPTIGADITAAGTGVLVSLGGTGAVGVSSNGPSSSVGFQSTGSAVSFDGDGDLFIDGDATIGDADADVHAILGATSINTTASNAATTIGSTSNTGAVGISANNTITVDVASTSNNLVLNNIAPATIPVNMLWLDGSNNVRRTAFSGTADEGLMWDAATGDYKLGHTVDGSNPITSSRFVRINSGDLNFNTGSYNLLTMTSGGAVQMNGASVSINTGSTGITAIGNGTGTFQLTSNELNISTAGVITDATSAVQISDDLETTATTVFGDGTGTDNSTFNLGATGVISVNNGVAADLTINESTISRLNTDIAINPGASNLVSTNGSLTVGVNATVTNNLTVTNGSAVVTAGNLTVTAGNFNVSNAGSTNTIEGAFNANGNTAIGNSATDNVTLRGVVNINDNNGAATTNIGTGGTTGLVTIGSTSNSVTVGGIATLARGVNVAVQTVSSGSPYNLNDNNYVVICNNTTNDIVNLPSPVGRQGRLIVIKVANTGQITLQSAGGATIDGVTSIVLAGGTNISRTVVSDGTNWFVIGN